MLQCTIVGYVGTCGGYKSPDGRLYARVRICTNINEETAIWTTCFRNGFRDEQALQRFCEALKVGSQVTVTGRVTKVENNELTVSVTEIALPQRTQPQDNGQSAGDAQPQHNNVQSVGSAQPLEATITEILEHWEQLQRQHSASAQPKSQPKSKRII